MNVWRLQTKTGADHAIKIAEYCYDNHVAALGWQVDADINPLNYEKYEELSYKNMVRKFKALGDLSNTWSGATLYGCGIMAYIILVLLAKIQIGNITIARML